MHEAYCLVRNLCHQLQHTFYQIPCTCYRIHRTCAQIHSTKHLLPRACHQIHLCISVTKAYIRHTYIPRLLMIQHVASVSTCVDIYFGRLSTMRHMYTQRVLMSIHKYSMISMNMHVYAATICEYSFVFRNVHVYACRCSAC